MPPYTVEGEVIVLHRDLTSLDLFVRDFLAVLTRFSDYLLVSGFVSISTGRPRGTEDVDILVPVMPKEIFSRFVNELTTAGFWCYQGDTAEQLYPYLQERLHLRFARLNEIFPNMEFVPITPAQTLQYFEFLHPQKMRVQDFEFKVPPLEFEILYKEKILSGPKDLADARHLRTLFKDILSSKRFKEYEVLFTGI